MGVSARLNQIAFDNVRASSLLIVELIPNDREYRLLIDADERLMTACYFAKGLQFSRLLCYTILPSRVALRSILHGMSATLSPSQGDK